MDYSKKIFEMLGVKPHEKFCITDKVGVYYIDNNFCLHRSADNFVTYDKVSSEEMMYILRGNFSIIKKPIPTKEEQSAILYAKNCGYNWIAKDFNGHTYAYKSKPVKYRIEWRSGGLDAMLFRMPMSFVHWKDTEPYYIGV